MGCKDCIYQEEGRFMKKLGLLFMVALLSISFTVVTRGYAQGQKVVRITLIDENGSGEDGSAQVTDLGDGTVKVELIMMNAPEGAVQPAHIHKGSCATLDPNPAFPLESIKEGKSTSTLKTTLSELTKEKYAINVHESAANVARYVSCGNLPSAAVASGGTMTMEQVMSTLLDQATELAATAKKKEADASKNAYTAFHATFAAHENDIKAKDTASQTAIEDAMNAVNDELGKGDYDGAGAAADKLVDAVKGAQSKMMGSTGASTGTSTASAAAPTSLNDAVKQMQSQTQDIVRETVNKDKDGSQRAYDAFHTTFAANEDAIKAKNPEAQAHIETAMHEVRDAVAAGDLKKANTASNELVNEINDATREMSAMSASANDAMPGTGSGEMPAMLWALVLGALALACSGLWIARKAERR